MQEYNEITAYFPEKILDVIFKPSRYKVFHGGRGGGKSWAVARALLIKAAADPIRVLCVREFMSSIADSVHKLLSDQIFELGLESHFTIEKAQIYGRNGSEFRFAGLKTNPQGIKSYEGIDLAWAEEASNISKASWEILIPTIRKEKSEIWVTFNPDLLDDNTYQRFVINPRPNSAVVQINYPDNPFFPEVLREEMEWLKKIDDNAYQNVWMGQPKTFIDGAIYSHELKAAQEGGRLTKLPYDESQPVHTFWDLGFRDSTSIWFAQIVNNRYHIIDYYENNLYKIQHYLQILQTRGYIYGTHYLPHDAVRSSNMSSDRSVEATVRQQGGAGVRILPKVSVQDGIQAARTIFPNCYFDQEKCSDGITCLRKYRFDDVHSSAKYPIHDGASHGADAFRYLAMAIQENPGRKKIDMTKVQAAIHQYSAQPGSWMSR